MFIAHRFRKPIILGIDLAYTSIQLIQLQHVTTTYQVACFGYLDLPPDIMCGMAVRDISGLAELLRQLLSELGFWPCRWLEAAIAVPDGCTIRKTLNVSERLTQADLEELVHIELEKILPNSGGIDQELCFDFKRLMTENPSHLYDLLIVATRISYVQQRVAALQTLGVRVPWVDVESFAVQRVLKRMDHLSDALGIILVIELTGSHLKLLFYKNMTLIFMREETLAMDTLKAHHAQTMMGPYTLDMQSCLVYIKRACHFFYTMHPDTAAIQHLMLIGCLARASGLCQYLKHHFPNLYVDIANPFVHMHCDLNPILLMEDAPRYLTACGLALRAS